MGYKVPVGISNKHVHLCQADLEVLFGKGAELTVSKTLVQPGQFAAEEKVDIVGPKNTLKGVRVLGPVRPETQVELAMTDARAIGLKVPVKMSGDLAGTPGCTLIGPNGSVELKQGVIVAKRHIHLTDAQAKEAGVVDGEVVSMRCGSPERSLVFDNVVCRVGSKHEKECHIDTDEGNAAGLGNNDEIEILK